MVTSRRSRSPGRPRNRGHRVAADGGVDGARRSAKPVLAAGHAVGRSRSAGPPRAYVGVACDSRRRATSPSASGAIIDSPISWSHLGQPQFDRVVEALIHRRYDDGRTEVVPFDGRGGDGGRDILVRHANGRRTVYQLKYYPEGFSNGFAPRRVKIRDSFKAALRHDPHTWILVTPGNLTPPEETFAKSLGKKFAAGRKLRIRSMGRAALDVELSSFPDLLHGFTCDQLIEKAKILGKERDLLLEPEDLADRVRALGAVADDRDIDWRLDFARHGNVVVQTLVPKHPHAQSASPVRIGVDVSDAHPELAAAFERSLGFGVLDPLELPPEAVRSLEITGPAMVAALYKHVAVRLVPGTPTTASAPIEVFFPDADHPTDVYEGTLIHADEGHRGRTLRARVHQGATITWLLPHDGDTPVTVSSTLDATGLHPDDALACVALMRSLTSGRAFDVLVEGRRLGSFTTQARGETAEHDLELEALGLLAEDLSIVQRHCRRRFALPETVSALERVRVRCARLLIEGHCVTDPDPRIATLTLNGRQSPELDAFLDGEPKAVYMISPTWKLRLGHRVLDIGPISLYHPQARAAFEPDDRQDTSNLAGRRVRLTPVHGRFELWRPDEAAPPDRHLTPVPLDLPGYPDPV